MKKPSIAAKKESNYNQLINNIAQILEQGRKHAYSAINTILVRTYLEVGKQIAEYEQTSGIKAEYGSGLFERMAKDLRTRFGKGFSRSNIIYMRLIYLNYSKSQTLSDQLSWSHYVY